MELHSTHPPITLTLQVSTLAERVEDKYNVQKGVVAFFSQKNSRVTDQLQMGAAASIPSTREEALAEGYTDEQVDEFLKKSKENAAKLEMDMLMADTLETGKEAAKTMEKPKPMTTGFVFPDSMFDLKLEGLFRCIPSRLQPRVNTIPVSHLHLLHSSTAPPFVTTLD